MNIVKPNVSVIKHDGNPYRIIEKIGRICYKSEDKITSVEHAAKFVNMLIKRNHTAMLEHEHIYFICTPNVSEAFKEVLDVEAMRYFNVSRHAISGSFRAFFELFKHYLSKNIELINALYILSHKFYPDIFDSEYIRKPKHLDRINSYLDVCQLQLHTSRDTFVSELRAEMKDRNEIDIDEVISKHLIHTLVFTCDRGVSHELVRHRNCGFAQESTRYCNYSASKFNHSITFIDPSPCIFKPDSKEYKIWCRAMKAAEKCYFKLIDNGMTPQVARDVLPTSVKTEIAVTATEEEWQHILYLRYHGRTGQPHPQMKEVMNIAFQHLKDISEYRLI